VRKTVLVRDPEFPKADAISLEATITRRASGVTVVVIVTPANLTIPATLVSSTLVGQADAFGDCPEIDATFPVEPPDGTWWPADNGTYTVTPGAGSLADLSGNTMAGGTPGNFTVSVPASPTPTRTPTPTPAPTPTPTTTPTVTILSAHWQTEKVSRNKGGKSPGGPLEREINTAQVVDLHRRPVSGNRAGDFVTSLQRLETEPWDSRRHSLCSEGPASA
jgi:hypothetical protein